MSDISIVLIIIFVALVFVCWTLTMISMNAWGGYQAKFTAQAEMKLERMFLFFDYKKVFFTNVGLLILVPLGIYLYTENLLFTLLALALVLALPKIMLSVLQKQRKQKIIEALPDSLAQIAGSLRSGATFTGAVETMVNESRGPVGQEFGLLLKEQKLGISPEDALENLGERVAAEEIDLIIAAALIARDVGGNLAETFERLSSMLRRKIEMEGKIKALTSQGKLQGWVVGALPFGIIFALLHVEPEGMGPIFTTYLGWAFLLVIIILEILGAIVIRRIVSIDI